MSIKIQEKVYELFSKLTVNEQLGTFTALKKVLNESLFNEEKYLAEKAKELHEQRKMITGE